MSTSIPQHFIKQYESEVHEAYQRQGSKLRNTVRTKTNVTGSTVQFPKVGKGVASKKTRHGTVPVMNVDHTFVTATLEDHYAGDWHDKLDEMKTNINERQVIANAGAMALGRKTDDIILEAISAATLETAVGTTGMTVDKIEVSIAEMGERDVPVDHGEMYGLIGWREWTDLLGEERFSSADYVPPSEMPYQGKGIWAKMYFGAMWMPHSVILPDGSDITTNYLYHSSAVGHAIGHDVSADITWHGDRAAHFINHMMSQGATLIDNNGVQKIKADRSP